MAEFAGMVTSLLAVSCSAGKVLVARVEKSWNGPHRIIFRGHDKFYARTSAGKFTLDVAQLLTAFLRTATVAEQINGFRLDRIIDIANDRAAAPADQRTALGAACHSRWRPGGRGADRCHNAAQ